MGSESCSVGRNTGKTMEIGRDTGDNSISGKDNKETDPYRFSNWALYILSLGAFPHVNLYYIERSIGSCRNMLKIICGKLLESAFCTTDTPLFCEKTLRKSAM